MMPCACGRPFVPDHDLYAAHVQTPEHQRWRIEVVEGQRLSPSEALDVLFGLTVEPDVDVREHLPSAWR